MKIHIVHGIRTWNNKKSFQKTVGRVLREQGFDVVEHYYGWLPAILARFLNKHIAKQLFKSIPDGSILVSHSNGCTLAWHLDQMNKDLYGCVLVQPALDADKILNMPDWVHVYYNDEDSTVGLAKKFIDNPWGEQGKIGPTDPPDYYECFDTKFHRGMPKAVGHSWYSSSERWLKFLGNKIKKAISMH